MRKQRLGLVDALESRPLVWSFLKGQHGDFFAPSVHSPARVADLLATGELDVGLIPSIELRRLPGLRLLPDLCIAARGAGIRVHLELDRPLAEVSRVAVPRASPAAVVLMQIVLRELYDLKPRVVVQPSALPATDCDARLRSGDATLRPPSAAGKHGRVDLGEGWQRLTGLPFVAAVWAVRDEVRLPRLPFYFKSSLRYGLSSLDHLVAETAAASGIDAAVARRYLSEELSFVLAEDELAGLSELFARSHAFGLAPGPRPLLFWSE